MLFQGHAELLDEAWDPGISNSPKPRKKQDSQHKLNQPRSREKLGMYTPPPPTPILAKRHFSGGGGWGCIFEAPRGREFIHTVETRRTASKKTSTVSTKDASRFHWFGLPERLLRVAHESEVIQEPLPFPSERPAVYLKPCPGQETLEKKKKKREKRIFQGRKNPDNPHPLN